MTNDSNKHSLDADGAVSVETNFYVRSSEHNARNSSCGCSVTSTVDVVLAHEPVDDPVAISVVEAINDVRIRDRAIFHVGFRDVGGGAIAATNTIINCRTQWGVTV